MASQEIVSQQAIELISKHLPNLSFRPVIVGRIVDDLIDAGLLKVDKQLNTKLSPVEVTQLQAYAKARNWVRWRRINQDYRWLKKVIQKAHYQPEDAKWILQ